MYSFSRILRTFNVYTNRMKTFLANHQCRQNLGQNPMSTISKPQLKQKRNAIAEIGPLGWFLLLIPTSTLGLGTWQIYRKQWKENLVAKLHELTNLDPIELPEDLSELEKMEYVPIHVRGHFLHDKEVHLGPRSLVKKGDAATRSQLISDSNTQGYLVITPLKLADRDETILVNRGWVPVKLKNARTRKQGQEEGEVDVIGIVRLTESRPNFTPKNQVKENQWFYKDLSQMAEVTGASPVLIDATNDFDKPHGPIGGQTRVSLRNEHLSYILTWYGLSIGTGYLWYKQFVQRVRI